MKAPFPVVLAVAALVGCATEYGPMTRQGGYADWSRSAGLHHIEVRVNRHSSPTAARAFFHRRAVELCLGPYEGEPKVEVDSYSAGYYTSVDSYGNAVSYGSAGGGFAGATAVGDVVCSAP